MNSQSHGVASLCLVAATIVLATVAGFLTSWVLGVVYLALCLAALAGILYAFCAKCPCQAQCGHVIPGKVTRILAQRDPGPYTAVELAVVVLSLLVLLALPQVWLWRYPALLIAFWVLTAISLVQIRAFVCQACDNVHCPAKAGS